MRTRAWRRYKLETIVKKRLQKSNARDHWWRFETANGDMMKHHIWVDEIGTYNAFFYKRHTTHKGDSKTKIKYSPNAKKKSYYRDKKPKGESFGTREADKREFLKILKKNGFK